MNHTDHNGNNMSAINEAATKGIWELLPCDSIVLAVHAALLHTGKVLFIAGSGNSVPKHNSHDYRSVVWDYMNGTFKVLTTPTDIFCSGHSFLADGRLLVAGGTVAYQSGDANNGTLRGFRGARTAYLFDPLLEEFIRVDDMEDGRRYPNYDGRWYPTLVTLSDGHIFTVSGLSATLLPQDPQGNQPARINELHEEYSATDGWAVKGTLQFNVGNTTWPEYPQNARWPLYPSLFLTSKTNRLFYSGGHVFGSENLPPGWLDISNNAFTPLNMISAQQASFELSSRDQSASVILPPAQDQRVMVIGGGKERSEPETGTRKVHVVDLKNTDPTYTEVASMHFPRMHLNAVLLPDRTVLVSGGEKVIEDKTSAALHAEIYDPSTNTWIVAAQATVPRMYHSIALLLPDAGVITAGSNPESADPGGGELQLELYHPPYLFRGPRPFIEHAPQELRYGETIEVSAPEAYDIKCMHMIRPMATTHSCDTEQRLVDLKFEDKGFCKLKASVPKQRNIAPPGWYMLFITNNRDVPSVAKWVHLS